MTRQHQLKFYPRVLHLFWTLKQSILSRLGGKSVGVQALVLRGEEVLLIQHTYIRGWSCVGGAVESAETLSHALKRELREEVGVIIKNIPNLFAVYYNDLHARDDYVAFYIVKEFTIIESHSPEIAEKRWFKLNDLPDDVTPSTLRRIQEYLGTRTISDRW